MMRFISLLNLKFNNPIIRTFSSVHENAKTSSQFETVFSFPTIKYFAVINRLKVYHLFGTSIALPSCGILETLNILPQYTFMTALYIGVTGIAVLSLATLPFNNIIGHLYISEDNKQIKISSLDFWGRRKDKVVATDEWIPLLDMKPSPLDALFLTPRLADGTKYKLFLKFGKVINSRKIGEVLE